MKKESLKQTIQQGFAGLFHICKQELKAVFKDQGVLIFFLLVPLAYPLVYAFIYTNEVVREVPVAVIDNSNTALSRQFIRTVDASADVHIQSHCADMEEGKNLLKETRVYGILYIPESFSKDISSGKQTTVSIYCDMSGMLYYKALVLASTNASLTLNKKIQIQRMGNTTERQDEISTAPIEYEDISLFNPQDGFASFLIPAVLILIIQQTLLLGIGLSAGTARENNRFKDLVPISRQYQGTLRIVGGKSLVLPPPNPLTRSSPITALSGLEIVKWWQSATAMPSVASSRLGGCSSERMRQTMAATCSLAADPRPVMLCLMRIGAYSETGRPRLSAAAMATPCARPSLSIISAAHLH